MTRRGTTSLSITLSFVIVATCAAVSGCAANGGTPKPGYQTVGNDPRRDTDKARAHNLEALDAIESGNFARAESLLKRALTADIMFGPAHNNLGKVYYHQDKLYLAAWEFEYAAKLMPHQAEPRNNLGMVFEAAGRTDDAVARYTEAVAMEPENPVLIGNLARARVRRGENDRDVRELLQKLVTHDTRPEWREWARRRLTLTPASLPASQPADPNP